MEATGDNADRIIARFQERYRVEGRLLAFEDGMLVQGKDCTDAWLRLQETMFNSALLKDYREGNRHVVPRVKLVVGEWKKRIPLEVFGYNPTLRMNRLKRNYLNLESMEKCLAYLSSRHPSKHSTHGISFGTGKKKTPPCMVGGIFHYAPGRLYCDFHLRASEVTKTLGADLHFLDFVIRNATPKWMQGNLTSVVIHLALAFSMAQWFPLFDMICPGYPIDEESRWGRMCLRSIALAQDVENYESKWKPERRMHRFYRKQIPNFRTDYQGRIVSGPSFLDRTSEHLRKGKRWRRHYVR